MEKDAFSTFLGAEVAIEGTIAFSGTIRIDGVFKGIINGWDGTLVVGQNAEITAEISVAKATVLGRVNGSLRARDRLDLRAPARIEGDIQAPVLAVEAGAVFNGTCSTKNPQIPAAKGSSEAVGSAVKGPKEKQN